MLFAGSTEGAHRACVLLGIIATCRALRPRAGLSHLGLRATRNAPRCLRPPARRADSRRLQENLRIAVSTISHVPHPGVADWSPQTCVMPRRSASRTPRHSLVLGLAPSTCVTTGYARDTIQSLHRITGALLFRSQLLRQGKEKLSF